MQKKNKAFQGLRGYAIVLIFLSHFNFMDNAKGINITTWLGGLGVELFILLSGFLLIENHAENNINTGQYLKHKLKKFYPLHIAMLIVAMPFSVKALLSCDFKALASLVSNILLLQTWIPMSDFYFGFNAVSWYLSITVFFILLSALVVKFWNKMSLKMTAVVIVCILAAQLMICGGTKSLMISHWIIYIAPFVRLLDFIIGGGIKKLEKARLVQNDTFKSVSFSLAITALIIIMVLSLYANNEWFSVCVWVIPSIIIVLILGADRRDKFVGRIFENKYIVKVGNYSFEIFSYTSACN